MLAPAGDWECAHAAVENGADAIYFGVDRFNARMRAKNFTLAELPELMAWLHERGVHGYITFNTLVFTEELQSAEEALRSIIAAGADAVIVQDVGIMRMIRQISPDFPINASTQMSITSAEGILFAEKMGAYVTALGRECSIQEIQRIQQERISQSTGSQQNIFPLEVFIHGALCVSCSGQCLASQALGGRSANRGECAQPCRLPYQLILNGKELPLGARKFLLSPKDLLGLEMIPDLIQAGVSIFKIEGRLKSPEYVSSVSRIYRQAIDAAWDTLSHNNFDPMTCRETLVGILKEKRYELEMTFSRGLGTGWMKGIDQQSLCHARYSGNKGFRIGKVTKIQHRSVYIRTQEPVHPGDGIAFTNPETEETVQGGRVYQVDQKGDTVLLEFSRQTFDFQKVRVGDIVYKTNDPALDRQLQQSYTTTKPLYRRPIQAIAEGSIGTVLKITFWDEQGHSAEAVSSMPLQEAHSQPLSAEKLRDQLNRLGDTPFRLEQLIFKVNGNCMIAVSELNRLRRELCEKLIQLRRKPIAWKIATGKDICKTILIPRKTHSSTEEPVLSVLIRKEDQLDAVLQSGIREIYCDFDDPVLYKKAVEKARSFKSENTTSPTLFAAPPRICRPGEHELLEQILHSGADGFLIRNYDHLAFFKGKLCRGDSTFNITNPVSADHYLHNCGLRILTLSNDLGMKQIVSMFQYADPECFELILHQHIPMFHTAFCLFCAYLTKEPGFPKCGMPCEHNILKIKDRTGIEHPILTDAGCRNTIFNGRIQTVCEYYKELRSTGLRRFRIEFVQESPENIIFILSLYKQLMRNEISGSQIWDHLRSRSFQLTRGSF